MNHKSTWFRLVAFAGAACMALGLAACGGSNANDDQGKTQENAKSSGPITVVASINQWGSLAQEIGGKDVNVTSIVNTVSVDAHDFEPKTSDIAHIQKAQVVVTNGAGYDSWASKSIVKGATSVSAADAVGAGKTDNAHLWFSKDARRAMAAELADAFAKARPAKAKTFQARFKTWQGKEKKLDETMKDFADKHKDASYGATEAVVYYLMDDMGFTDKTPKGYAQAVNSEGEPAPADLQSFQRLIGKRGIDVLVNNTQESNETTKLLTDAARQSKVPIVDVTEQMPSDQKNLTEWVGSLVEKLSQAMDDDAKSGKDNARGDADNGAKESGYRLDSGNRVTSANAMLAGKR
ncbi:zinc ABC transporter substrate-binding protein [Bifidobacterium sp. ESL0790]|uniref:metal ABC transporter solute-binding protein, Zn/Mn family n=1 Tax=Bifidobacterium sp. ESL0790 TaxID=2983233 RepID=UPI0023F95074|nr:zinc ABC transporter substrate-binding protein [Bifidobacterium sp. ESL0790]WEV73035.1 zinc ABC transporter substrate-binding protein [Bifidobacterium sp. ESL0790]